VTVASLAGSPAALKTAVAAPADTPPLENGRRELANERREVAVAPALSLKSAPPGAAPALAAFSGAWTGRWRDGPRAMVTVEQIEGRGAQLVYSFSAGNRRRPSPADSVHGRTDATFDDDGSLRATLSNGAKVVYRLSGEDSLQGEYVGKDVRYEGEFRRR
jgi:hypothetical protein